MWMESRKSCSLSPPSKVSVAASPTSSARRPMSTWTRGLRFDFCCCCFESYIIFARIDFEFVLFFFIFVRAGELSAAELDNLMTIVANPRQFKIPDWFLNRKKDYKDGKYSQVVSNALDMKLRDDLERLKKIRSTTVSLFFFYFISLSIYYTFIWNGIVCLGTHPVSLDCDWWTTITYNIGTPNFTIC